MKTEPIVTLDMLIEWGACRKAKKWLAATYPKGAPLSAAPEICEEWLAWLVVFAPDAYGKRACAALLARPGGPTQDSLHRIVEYAPIAYKELALKLQATRKK